MVGSKKRFRAMTHSRDRHTGNLFATSSNLRIIRITKDDVLGKADRVDSLFSQILKHETLYPDIVLWFKSKVLPGILEGNRVAYVGLNNESPVVSAVLKLGVHSKICHLHIDEGIRDKHLGDLFFSMMVLDAKRRANEVHFTLPESVWFEKVDFFRSFGFQHVTKSTSQYRSFEDELKCSAPFREVWQRVLEKLPRIITSLTKTQDSIFSGILMSIKPEYIKKIQSGEKVVEIRSKFNSRWRGCRITIYSSRPLQALHGYATIENVMEGPPEQIWSQFGDNIGGSKKDFDTYTSSLQKVYAITLKNYEPYLNPISFSQLEGLLNQQSLRPPQSYFSLEKNIDWARAVSIAELLHNRFWVYHSGL